MSLKIVSLRAGYGELEVLHGINLEVGEGKVVGLLGPNGAGKTTLLRAISGLLSNTKGQVLLDSVHLERMAPHDRVQHGLVHVPEGRGLFSGLTVEENLLLCHPPRASGRSSFSLEPIYELFPELKRKRSQRAGTLSGGEQQMLALARAFRLDPRVLLLDEPSAGLAPVVVERFLELVTKIASKGVAVLLVEQAASIALDVVTRVVVLAGGRLILDANRREVSLEDIRYAYLGV